MTRIDLPPFYVGQRVVAISDHSQGAFKKGDEFTIGSIVKTCCKWCVTIGIKANYTIRQCSVCKQEYLAEQQWLFNADMFVPLEEKEFKNITFEKLIEAEPICAQ